VSDIEMNAAASGVRSLIKRTVYGLKFLNNNLNRINGYERRLVDEMLREDGKLWGFDCMHEIDSIWRKYDTNYEAQRELEIKKSIAQAKIKRLELGDAVAAFKELEGTDLLMPSEAQAQDAWAYLKRKNIIK